jgi:hypothetical protein
MDVCVSETMVSKSHLAYLETVIDEVAHLEGAIVECGVWKGGCCMWMMLCQKKHGTSREFFLYDTFDGMTFPGNPNDAAEAQAIFNRIQDGAYKRPYDSWHTEKKWAYAPIDLVKANIGKVGYEPSKIQYVKGDINSTLDSTVPSAISILRLDTDWYDSTKKELDVLFPLVVKGGYVVVDDYYAWKGAKVATDEFLSKNGAAVSIIDRGRTGGIMVLKKL